MQIAKFELSPPHDCGSVACDEFGPKVGSVRLMKRTLDEYGDEVWAPRDAETLNALLATHYRSPIDIGNKIEGLRAVARALNKGDVTHAYFVTIFLQFPIYRLSMTERKIDTMSFSNRCNGAVCLRPMRSGTRNIHEPTSHLIEAGSHPYRKIQKPRFRLEMLKIGGGPPRKQINTSEIGSRKPLPLEYLRTLRDLNSLSCS